MSQAICCPFRLAHLARKVLTKVFIEAHKITVWAQGHALRADIWQVLLVGHVLPCASSEAKTEMAKQMFPQHAYDDASASARLQYCCNQKCLHDVYTMLTENMYAR